MIWSMIWYKYKSYVNFEWDNLKKNIYILIHIQAGFRISSISGSGVKLTGSGPLYLFWPGFEIKSINSCKKFAMHTLKIFFSRGFLFIFVLTFIVEMQFSTSFEKTFMFEFAVHCDAVMSIFHSISFMERFYLARMDFIF